MISFNIFLLSSLLYITLTTARGYSRYTRSRYTQKSPSQSSQNSENICIVSTSSTADALPCKSSIDCVQGDSFEEFCNKDGLCQQVEYVDFLNTLPNVDESSDIYSGTFSLLMFSDVQYGLAVCHDNPCEECIFSQACVDNHGDNCPLTVEEAADKQLACINTLYGSGSGEIGDVGGIFDVGDMTHFDHSDLSEIKTFHGNAISELASSPLMISMGNHDYEHGTFPVANEDRIKRIEYFQELMLNIANTQKVIIRNIDLNVFTADGADTYTTREEKFYQGSMAFTIEMGQHVFIMTHYAITMSGLVHEDQFSIENSADPEEPNHFYDLFPGIEWIRDEIINVHLEGKKIYLVVHAFGGLKAYLSRDTINEDCVLDGSISDYSSCSLLDAIRQANILGVFSGHTHHLFGYQGDTAWDSNDVENVLNSIPVWYASSNSYQKLISVKMNIRGIENVIVWDTSKGKDCASHGSSDESDGAKCESRSTLSSSKGTYYGRSRLDEVGVC